MFFLECLLLNLGDKCRLNHMVATQQAIGERLVDLEDVEKGVEKGVEKDGEGRVEEKGGEKLAKENIVNYIFF